MEAVEIALRRRVFCVAAELLAHAIDRDHSDGAQPYLACTCGQPARYAGRKRKRFVSVLGVLELERAYYHCATCQRGFFPRDRSLGFFDGSLSPALVRMVGVAASTVSFQEASQLLDELAGVEVDPKQVERYAEELGREIERDEREHVPPPAPKEICSTLYLSLDGTGVPMRKSELVGRAGKQEDGSSKTREMKLCAVFSAQGRDENGVPVRDEGSVSYSVAIESAASQDGDSTRSPFAQRAAREGRRRGFARAERQVILGDGAAWIWNIAEDLYPAAIQIVDRFHAKQHASEVAKVIFGIKDPRSHAWAKDRHTELDKGDIEAVLDALVPYKDRSDEARRAHDYFFKNRERMRYRQLREQGLCTSSGVIEAGCKRVVGDRLKRCGMHWTVRGANAISALRACRLSGRFADFWDRRAQALRAA